MLAIVLIIVLIIFYGQARAQLSYIQKAAIVDSPPPVTVGIGAFESHLGDLVDVQLSLEIEAADLVYYTAYDPDEIDIPPNLGLWIFEVSDGQTNETLGMFDHLIFHSDLISKTREPDKSRTKWVYRISTFGGSLFSLIPTDPTSRWKGDLNTVLTLKIRAEEALNPFAEMTNLKGKLQVEYAYEAKVPLIFIPGIAGSVLEADLVGNLNYQLWPSIFPQDIALLNLRDGSKTVRAVDVVRKVSITGYEALQEVYGPWIDYLTEKAGHTEFLINGDRSKLTTGFVQATANVNPKPTLFCFPYDWRRSNADHIHELQELISNIRQLHGTSKVDIVTHSMGGLLLRQYMLEYGDDDLNRVVTVACPFWGAPVAIYRMLQGDFFGFPLPDVDIVNNPFFRDSLPTFPSFHELLPSTPYLDQAGSILSEGDQDLDGDRVRGEVFETAEMRAFVNSVAAPNQPFVNNLNFHTTAQDNWSGDTGDLEILHLYGVQPEPKTTVKVLGHARVVRAVVLSILSKRPVFEIYRYKEEKGLGDGVVPYLSARRPGNFQSSGARYYPVPSTSNDAAEHSEMLTELSVHQIIDSFLSTGEVNDPSLPSPAPFQSLDLAGTSGSRRIEIFGVGFVDLADGSGNTNTRISEIAARQIPGVQAEYGGDSPSVDIGFGSSQELTISGDPNVSVVEFDYTECDSGGVVVSLHRYRLEPQGLPWTMTINGSNIPELRWDSNNDGQFTQDEVIAATHTASGTGIDMEAPTVTLELTSSVNGTISVTLSAMDATDPTPTIQYSMNDGPIADYTSNLVFPPSSDALLNAFATDSMGNTSGLIQTQVRPSLKAKGSAGTTDIEWSIAEGYVLEEATDLTGTWTQSPVLIQRDGTREKVSVPTGGEDRKFFRLRSQRIEK